MDKGMAGCNLRWGTVPGDGTGKTPPLEACPLRDKVAHEVGAG